MLIPLPISVLLLVGIANGSPVLAAWLLRDRWDAPLDRGQTLSDGQRLFGKSKTVRGVAVSVSFTTVAALALGFDWHMGAAIALGAMAGDLLSSFIKRRLGLKPHTQAFGLDQIPEALLPVLLVKDSLGLSWVEVGMILVAFVAVQLPLSQWLFRCGIRDRPY